MTSTCWREDQPIWQREAVVELGGEPRLPMSAVLARLVMGDIADGLILASLSIAPRRLRTTGYRYRFRFPVVEAALRHETGALSIVV